MNEACAIAALPTHQQTQRWGDLAKRFAPSTDPDLTSGRVYSIGLFPNVVPIANAAHWNRPLLSCVAVALAAERYRLAHGHWPDTAAALCPGFLPEVPSDPFDGQPLRLVHRQDGLVIYSVDVDGQDDGGVNLQPAREGERGKDLGVRFWDEVKRGLAPEALGGNGCPFTTTEASDERFRAGKCRGPTSLPDMQMGS